MVRPNAPLRVDAETREKMKSYFIHAKDLTQRFNIERARRLIVTPDVLENFDHEMQWLTSDDRYSCVDVKGVDGIPQARLKPDFTKRLIECGLIEQIDAANVRGHVRLFLLPEHAKGRFRPIRYTKDINDACGRDTLRPCVIPTKADIVPAVLKGQYMILLDLAAMFDQFELALPVSQRMCFQQDALFYRLKVMAMGQRQAVGVANAAMQCLLDFPKKSTHCGSIIDNACFIGDTPDDVIHDATLFITRCAEAGVTLNEIHASTATPEKIAQLVTTVGDWGGVNLNLVTKEVKITAKSVKKTAESWARRATWLNREYAGHIGLLFWAWRILDLPMAEFFPVLRFNSLLAQWITTHQPPQLPDGSFPENPVWELPAEIHPSVWPVLQRWTDLVIANTPRVVRPIVTPEFVMQCDASRWGHAYIAVNTATAEVYYHAERWDDFMERNFGHRLGKSCFAEPLGNFKSHQHLLRQLPHVRSCHCDGDNTPTEFTNIRGFSSRSFHLNACIAKRAREFPPSCYQLTDGFVQGKKNLSDLLSRGLATSISEEDIEAIRAYADTMLRSWRG